MHCKRGAAEQISETREQRVADPSPVFYCISESCSLRTETRDRRSDRWRGYDVVWRVSFSFRLKQKNFLPGLRKKDRQATKWINKTRRPSCNRRQMGWTVQEEGESSYINTSLEWNEQPAIIRSCQPICENGIHCSITVQFSQ